MGRKETRDPARPAYQFIPAELAERLPNLYATQHEDDPLVWIKLFTPDSSWTWYLIEYDPLDRLAFGLVQGHEEELGYFSLEELEQLRGPLGLPVERDLHFAPRRLAECRAGAS